MKRLFYPVAAIVIMVGSAFTVLKSQDWKIADNYRLNLMVATLLVSLAD